MRLYSLIPLLSLLALPAQAQDVQIMRGGKIAPEPSEAVAKTAAPECKKLSTGDTFCKVAQNGVSRWVLQARMRPGFKVGDEFPVYQHSMIINLNRYDLPAVTGAWRYYAVQGVIYRVGAEDHKVLEVMGRH